MNFLLFSKRAISLAVLLLVLAMPAMAQLQSGNLHGIAAGVEGTPMPGVTVTLTGVGAPQTTTTDEQGRFRFLGLSPGLYTVESALQGFASDRRDNVEINVGRNTEVTLTVRVTDVIEVRGERADAPLLDTRRVAQSQTVTLTELESIPTARDPWAVLSSMPGVLTDRINVGGNESGQQSHVRRSRLRRRPGRLVARRHGDHRHVGHRLLARLLRLRVVRGDAGDDRRQRRLDRHRRRGAQHGHPARRQRSGAAPAATWSRTTACSPTSSSTASDLGQAGPWNNGNAQTAFKQGNRIVENVGLTAPSSAAPSSRTACGSGARTPSRRSTC